ncbi:MAG: hypothetical protein IJ866_02825 [Alphaproteobacteria bacterium]|nr:hypothetical protein [Alphaproteobacteria bacterium]
MKKILMFLCCAFIAAPAFATDCSTYGVEAGQWFLENKGSYWQVKQCKNDRNGNPELGSAEKVQFCDNPNEDWVGWESRPFIGNATLHIRTASIAKPNIDGTGNVALTEYRDKNTACYYCDDGYSYKNGKCVEDMAQSCTQLSVEKCKNNTHLIESGGNGCYVCDQGQKASCRAGNRIFMKRAHIGKQDDIENQVWECNPARKTWTHRDPYVCNGSVDLSVDVRAGRATLEIVNPNRSSSHNNASSWVVDNGDICYKYTCNAGWVQSGGKCIQDADYKTLCTNSGGIYDEANLSCVCADVKGLVLASDGYRCECKEGADFAWNAAADKCEKTTSAVRRDEQRQQQRQRQQQQQSAAKKACIESGGEWVNNACTCRAEKNIVLSNGKCECRNADFKFESAAVGCVEKDEAVRRRACEAASETGAYWNGTACLCNGTDMVFVGGRCQKSADAAACEAAGDTVWNSVTKVCNCKKVGYEWTGEKCEESAESIAAREEAARRQRVTKSSAAIESASKKLDDIMAGLKISVWKTSEGNFNGARLASDSIAGVVLGTAGGLITSNVVKKNQVKTGFEDISCTVGGQRVADWGDEFMVGIR